MRMLYDTSWAPRIVPVIPSCMPGEMLSRAAPYPYAGPSLGTTWPRTAGDYVWHNVMGMLHAQQVKGAQLPTGTWMYSVIC
jgi:hypothetical protein